MKLVNVDLKKVEQGVQLDVDTYTPTLGWTDVSLSLVVYLMPPVDGIQDVVLNGTPPDGFGLTSILSYSFSIFIPETDWFKGVRIIDSNNKNLTTIRTPIRNGKPIGDDWVAVEAAGLKGDKLIVDVIYSGGGLFHSFQLNWDGAVMESFPPQIVLDISHNSNGDMGKALISERLQFDLSVILDDTPDSYIIRVRSDCTEIIAHHPNIKK